MNEHYRPTPGTPIEDLDTPCLIIDMDDLDNNMDVIASTYAGTTAKLRGHAKNHKTPAIAHRQIRRGGTVGGVCAAKVSEAEVMVHGGIASVFITSEIVELMKIDRLCSLADQAELLVACEQPANARDISKAATARGVEIGVIIESPSTTWTTLSNYHLGPWRPEWSCRSWLRSTPAWAVAGYPQVSRH